MQTQSFRPSVSLMLGVRLALVVLAGACGGGSGIVGTGGTVNTGGNGNTPTPVITTSVTLQNIAFVPQLIQVIPGATVTFNNMDGIAHTVTFAASSIVSVDAFSTGIKSVVMPTVAGTYDYRCTIHPNMTGSVIVK